MHRFDVRKVIPVLLLGLMMCVFPNSLRAQTQDLEIHYINVQQGQCTLIIGPDGTTILYDGGNEEKGTDEVVPYLQNLGITTSQTLDYIVVSHHHTDHYCGLTEVLEYGYDVDTIYDNGNYVETTANHYVMYIDKNGVPNPALIVMKSTQLKKSRKWNSMMMSVQLQGANGLFRPPMFSQQYRLTVVSESNDRGKWHGWEIERIGSVEDSGVYQSAKAFAESINAGQVNVKHEKEGGAAGGDTHTHF